jgi:hypothetical protein
VLDVTGSEESAGEVSRFSAATRRRHATTFRAAIVSSVSSLVSLPSGPIGFLRTMRINLRRKGASPYEPLLSDCIRMTCAPLSTRLTQLPLVAVYPLKIHRV